MDSERDELIVEVKRMTNALLLELPRVVWEDVASKIDRLLARTADLEADRDRWKTLAVEARDSIRVMGHVPVDWWSRVDIALAAPTDDTPAAAHDEECAHAHAAWTIGGPDISDGYAICTACGAALHAPTTDDPPRAGGQG